mmetsp:Transcript_32442/g.32143  ORF Transcript_32442/g.32143 Transcript_32442/m.32143 type:complete len:447 (-) Transcript_32442:19-1359(-)
MQLCLDIRKGVPNYLIRNVICKLITFDNEIAKTEYYDYTNNLDPELNFSELPPSAEPLFGRKDLMNCFLTFQGATVCKTILYVIHKKSTDIEACLILPRIVQALLWFMKEHETYQIIQVLIAESRYRENCPKFTFHFPLTVIKHKRIVKNILRKVKEMLKEIEINDKKIEEVIKDIAFNMLIGYISPSFYPLILMNFLADGIGSIMKFTAAIVYLALKKCEELRDGNKTIPDWKSYARTQVAIFKILKKAFKINFGKPDATETSSVATDSDVFNYVPYFDGASAIMKSQDDIHNLCTLIPKLFLKHRMSLMYSITSNGLDSAKFMSSIINSDSPIIILVETKKNYAIGIFVDRTIENDMEMCNSECKLFSIRPEKIAYSHKEDEMIIIRANMKTGFSVLSQEGNIIFQICPGMITGISNESSAFNSKQLFKNGEFSIFNIEIYKVA